MTPRARTCPGVSLFFDEFDTAIFGAALISSIIGDGIFLPESDRGHSSGAMPPAKKAFITLRARFSDSNLFDAGAPTLSVCPSILSRY
jgi:hypothetical protein